MRNGLLWVLLLGTATISAQGEETSIQFLSRAEASAALTDGPAGAYYTKLQLAEMRAKTRLALKDMDLAAAREVTKQTFAAATEDFTEDERAALREAIEATQPMILAQAPLYARTPWSFIKISDTIEGGLPHSRGDSIVLSESLARAIASAPAKAKLDHPSGLWALLLHEQTHVLQRKYPQLFVSLYTDVFGFRQVEVTPPDSLLVQRVINPDGPIVEWIYPLGKGDSRQWILPDIELSELNHPKMPADFKEVALRVHQVDGSHWAVDDKEPVAMLESLPEYVGAFPVKSELFHPNEIAADMLAEILYGGPKENPQHELWSKTQMWAAKALR
jgi:hypothetical protein